MKKLNTFIKHTFLIISLSFLTVTTGFTQTITNSGLIFNPDTLQVTVGDNISFNISASHNAVEVSETTFNNNGSTSNNGFNIPYGGGSWTADSIKTYYYVCQPHVSMGMKGVIISNPPACNKSLTQQLEGFDPNPLFNSMEWSYDTLSLENTSDCNIRVRPEFVIAHDSLAIGANDLVLKWYNPYTGAWPAIPYYINANGHAVGFWSSSGNDTTGQEINQGVTNQIIIRVKFWPTANYGNYSANWTTKEVDLNGNIIQTLAIGDSTTLSLVDCSAFGVDSSYTTNISCNGFSDGEAGIVSIENGSGDYTYNWGNGNTSSSINNLPAGDYYCIVTDLNWQQCSDSIGFSISEPYIGLVINLLPNNVVCYGDDNGDATAIPNGGTAPYTYFWSNGDTSSFISVLSAGYYACTVTDANGCMAYESIPVTEGNQIFSNLTYTDATCFGANDGNATVTPSGGSGALSILWWDGTTTSSVTGLIPAAGLYWVQITDNNNPSCVITEYFDISEPAELTSFYTQTNVSCNGANDGSAVVTFSGGTIGSAPGDTNYILGWAGTPMPVYLPYPQDVFNTTLLPPPYNAIPPGIYPYTVTDLNGCTIFDTITITEPDSLSIGLSASIICCYGDDNGDATAIPNGGTAPYTYFWDTWAQTSQTATNLAAGTQYCAVTDYNGCIIQDSIIVTENAPITASFTTTNPLCFGDNTGCIYTTAIGGDGNYTYLWSSGQTTADICNLSAGTYSCTVTDGCGCTTVFTTVITESVELTSFYTQTNVTCNGADDGGALVTFSGGTIGNAPGDTNYILGWAGTPMPVYLPYPQDVFNTTLLPPPYNAIPPGIYPYTVTDLNGCTIFDTITITEPDSLYLNYSTTNFNGHEISCNGLNDGEIDIQVTGGTFPFDNYLNGTLQGSLISTNLVDGIYTDSIIDANGCTATTTIILTEPFELVSTLTSTNISCNGICDGEITSSTSGGVSPYSFAWSPQNQTTNTISNLCPGNYTLNLTDGNGCPENVSTTITEPYPINFTIDSIFDISTYGGADGAIYITANGGSGLLTYSWTDSFTFTSTDADIASLNASVYGLVITDSNSCVFDTLIELSQPSSLILFLDSINIISCFDSCDASIFITASGGDSAYTYNWSGPNNFTATTANIFNLCYGEYILDLSDSITTIIDTFNIYQPQPLSSILSADSILCHNDNAQAEINVWGGTQFFTYLWSNGDVNYITNLSSGNHGVIVTDQNGCSISNSITLSNPDSILAQTTTTNVSCNGFSDGTDSINVSSGGLTPYVYSNNNGLTYQNSNVFSNLSAGNYSYLISDFNGCLGSASAVISEPSQLTSITESDSISCYDECDGNIYAIANGGTQPYAFNWGGSSTNLCAGIYNVTITDANGCLASNSAIIYEPNPLVINIWINVNTIEATSGFATYQWFDANGNPISGATSEIFSPSSMGEYYVVVTDGICEESSYVIYYNVSSVNNIANDFKIYPNPTQGIITIENNISFESISILNTIGNQLLLVEKNNNDKGLTELDLSTFAKGIYFIQIEQNNQIMNYRIVLQ